MKDKICCHCKTRKPISEFFANKKAKDKLGSWCKVCTYEFHKRNYSSEKARERDKKWRKNNPEKSIAAYTNWYRRNKDTPEYRKKKAAYHRARLKTDVNFHLAFVLRKRIYNVQKRGSRAGSSVRDLGCTIEELRKYLESKWLPGMNWDNYGGVHGWQIDHIYPLSKLNLADRKEFLKANHYTNLQPLWARDNRRKLNKILTTFNTTSHE
jgi:uncharacterized OB-fold protein